MNNPETTTQTNGNGTVTERAYQDAGDRRMAERTAGSPNPPSVSVQERTVEKQ